MGLRIISFIGEIPFLPGPLKRSSTVPFKQVECENVAQVAQVLSLSKEIQQRNNMDFLAQFVYNLCTEEPRNSAFQGTG